VTAPAGDAITEAGPSLSAAALSSYMRATGWVQEGPQGSHGTLFARGAVAFTVPHEDDRPGWVTEALGRLASAEGRSVEETAAAVRAYAETSAPVKPCGCSPLEPCGPHLDAGLAMPPDEFAALDRTYREWCRVVREATAAERERADKAVATLDRLRSVLLEGGQGADMARRRALAILESNRADHG
jgi:predicted RNA binding protein YcfA (HicA-like mRNA interferase family)